MFCLHHHLMSFHGLSGIWTNFPRLFSLLSIKNLPPKIFHTWNTQFALHNWFNSNLCPTPSPKYFGFLGSQAFILKTWTSSRSALLWLLSSSWIILFWLNTSQYFWTCCWIETSVRRGYFSGCKEIHFPREGRPWLFQLITGLPLNRGLWTSPSLWKPFTSRHQQNDFLNASEHSPWIYFSF